MKKLIEVEIKDIDISRNMIQLAGYYESKSMSDDEVFNTIMSMIECYGAEWKVLGKKD